MNKEDKREIEILKRGIETMELKCKQREDRITEQDQEVLRIKKLLNDKDLQIERIGDEM